MPAIKFPKLTLNGAVELEPADANVVFPAPLLMKYSTVCGAVPNPTVDEAVTAPPDRINAPFVGALRLTDTGSVAASVTPREKLSI